MNMPAVVLALRRQLDVAGRRTDVGPEIGRRDAVSAAGGQQVTAVQRAYDAVRLVAAQQPDVAGSPDVAAWVAGESGEGLVLVQKGDVRGRAAVPDDHHAAPPRLIERLEMP